MTSTEIIIHKLTSIERRLKAMEKGDKKDKAFIPASEVIRKYDCSDSKLRRLRLSGTLTEYEEVSDRKFSYSVNELNKYLKLK